jgi:uncharacterized protein YxeA
MKLWKKVTLWIIGIVIVSFGGLMALGLSMHSAAEKYVMENSDYKKVETIMQSDKILCAESGTGLVVVERDTKEEMYFPICVSMFGETTLGNWEK